VRYTLSWSGLRHDTRYLGVVAHGDSESRTIVLIDSGAEPPVNENPPTLTGTAEVGDVLTVEPGSWNAEDLSFAYHWLRDGEPIAGEVGAEYRVTPADVGTALSAEVTATRRDNVNSGTSVTGEVIVNAASIVDVTMNRYVGTTAQQYAVTLAVHTSRGEPAGGEVSVRVDGAEYTGTLANGTVTFALPSQAPGIHVVVAEYAGTEGIDGSTGVSGYVVNE
jgi:hypothetical protein